MIYCTDDPHYEDVLEHATSLVDRGERPFDGCSFCVQAAEAGVWERFGDVDADGWPASGYDT